MLHSPRYRRPPAPRHGLRLQPRDLCILTSLARFRLLASSHLAALCSPGRSLRVTQGRLRLLFEHALVDRVHLPLLVGSTFQPRTGPVYALAKRGASVLVEAGHALPPSADWGFPSRGFGGAALHHHLVVSDLLVGLALALDGHPTATLVEACPERNFRSRVEAVRGAGAPPSGYVIPDGGFVLRRGTGPPRAYYVEVVRADVRGGNATLRAKMLRYVELNRSGALRELYGHERLRAILFLTTSLDRAERLRRLAESLPHGRQLFWFGAYAAPAAGGRLLPSLSASNVLAERWRSATGRPLGFLTDADGHARG